MRTIIAGSRSFNDYRLFCDLMGAYLKTHTVSTVICGKAKGPDSMGARWARENNVPVEDYPADWDALGRSAGLKRNVEMAKIAEQLVDFWDGKSPGSRHMIEHARDVGLDTTVFHVRLVEEGAYMYWDCKHVSRT